MNEQQTRSAPGAEDHFAWRLDLVYHPNPEFVGRACAVDGDVRVGRGEGTFGSEALDDTLLSRRHARVHFAPDGGLRIADEGSRNGTFVNAKRVSTGALADGDVIGVGNVLLLVSRDSIDARSGSGDVVAHAGVTRSVVETIRRSTQGGPVLLHGESGTGKSTLAQLIHEQRAGSTSCSSTRDWNEGPPRGATWIIEDVDSLSAADQGALLGGLPRFKATNVFIVSCSTRSPSELRERLDPRLANRLARWCVHVPPLRRRRADIVPLARWFARRYRGAPAALGAELTFVLLRHRWPGNLHELEAVVERAVVESEPERPLRRFSSLEADLLRGASTQELSSNVTAVPADGFVLQRNAAWFETPTRERVDLSKREVLRRVLSALVETHERWPGRVLRVSEIVARGWPGERMHEKSGANRAYVALATLRKLGLRDVLVRTDGGYRLDTNVTLRIVR